MNIEKKFKELEFRFNNLHKEMQALETLLGQIQKPTNRDEREENVTFKAVVGGWNGRSVNITMSMGNIGYAIGIIKADKKAKRQIWTNGQFIYLIDAMPGILYPNINVRLSNGMSAVWTPGYDDLLAKDWMLDESDTPG